MKQNKILLINDVCGYGKVATAAMLPILSYMGNSVYNLPTALVSNTLDYGTFSILETTDYIKGVFPVWRELGFSFDAIATGFIASENQAKIVAQYCREEAAHGTHILVDPIMGDEGKLYNGVTPATINSMREMLSVAHLCFPNYTEACYLTDTPYNNKGIARAEVKELIDKLRGIGSRSVLITSLVIVEDEEKKQSTITHHPSPTTQHAVAGYNHLTDEYFFLPYEEIPVHFPGTGDIFSAIVDGHLLRGDNLQQSARIAMDTLSKWIEANKENHDKNRGIPLERHLEDL